MFGRLKMSGGMAVRRRVATADVAATEAQAQMNPAAAGLDAVVAKILFGVGDLDLIQMRALPGHDLLQSQSIEFPRSMESVQEALAGLKSGEGGQATDNSDDRRVAAA